MGECLYIQRGQFVVVSFCLYSVPMFIFFFVSIFTCRILVSVTTYNGKFLVAFFLDNIIDNFKLRELAFNIDGSIPNNQMIDINAISKRKFISGAIALNLPQHCHYICFGHTFQCSTSFLLELFDHSIQNHRERE